MLKSGFYMVLLLTGCQMVTAQEKSSMGSWTTLNAKHKFDDKWSAYMELQGRSLALYDRFYYYEWKGGATYAINQNYSFTLGTGLYNTFNEGPEFEDYAKQKEFRIWEQFNMEHNLSIAEIEHRYRVEQKFTDKYANRFRYRLNVNIPLNHLKMDPKTLYLSTYNEVFFNDKLPHFSRNRFQAGAGYIFSEKLTVQAGWLRQVDFSKTGERRKNYLFGSVAFSF